MGSDSVSSHSLTHRFTFVDLKGYLFALLFLIRLTIFVPFTQSEHVITKVPACTWYKGSSQKFTLREQMKELSYGREGVWTRFVVRSTVTKKKGKKARPVALHAVLALRANLQ